MSMLDRHVRLMWDKVYEMDGQEVEYLRGNECKKVRALLDDVGEDAQILYAATKFEKEVAIFTFRREDLGGWEPQKGDAVVFNGYVYRLQPLENKRFWDYQDVTRYVLKVQTTRES